MVLDVAGMTRSPVVVGIDGAPDGALALRWALAEVRRAGRCARQLRLVHVRGGDGGDPVIGDAVAFVRSEAPGVELSTVTRPVMPADVLLDAATDAACWWPAPATAHCFPDSGSRR